MDLTDDISILMSNIFIEEKSLKEWVEHFELKSKMANPSFSSSNFLVLYSELSFIANKVNLLYENSSRTLSRKIDLKKAEMLKQGEKISQEKLDKISKESLIKEIEKCDLIYIAHLAFLNTLNFYNNASYGMNRL